MDKWRFRRMQNEIRKHSKREIRRLRHHLRFGKCDEVEREITLHLMAHLGTQ